jgi:hypothetical protein
MMRYADTTKTVPEIAHELHVGALAVGARSRGRSLGEAAEQGEPHEFIADDRLSGSPVCRKALEVNDL